MKQRHVRGKPAPAVVDLRPSPLSPRKGRRRDSRRAFVGCGLVVAALLWMLMHLANLIFIGEVRRPPRRRRLPPRFPRYGTPEFAETCKWAVDDDDAEEANAPTAVINATQAPNLTSLVPWVRQSEGIASWVTAVAQSYIYSRYLARQNHGPPPKVLLEFGAVNLTEVMDHPAARRNNPKWEVGPRHAGKKPRKIGWAIGDAYHWCTGNNKCMTIEQNSPRGIVPLYRYIYKHTSTLDKWVSKSDFEHLYQMLPGFTIETGMACALNSMWEPSRSLAKYEPELFTRLFPTLRGASDDGRHTDGPGDTLVLTLYLRTGWTDQRMQNKNLTQYRENAKKHLRIWDEGADAELAAQKAEAYLKPFVACARQLEREYFANYSSSGEEAAFSKVVWMVSADSFVLKRYVHDTYGGQEVALAPSISGESDPSTVSVSRDVVYTGVDGKHTKLQWDPGQAALAEGYIDWHLMGESDALIAEGGFYTFGTTAGLRTARPIYVPAKIRDSPDRGACTRQVMLRAE